LLLCRLVLRRIPPPHRSRLRRIAGAGLGGLAGTALDVAVLVTLVESGAPISVAAFAGAAAGAAVCFTLNKRLAFGDRTPLSARQLGTFAAVAAVSATLMAIAMHLATHEARLPYLLAKALCAATVFAVWSYPAQRRLVFRRPESPLELSLDPARSLA
jgi:putative flippase GtrA